MSSECTHKNCSFENDKCIFHCEKNIENGWIVESDDKYLKINKKIFDFWTEFIDKRFMVFLILKFIQT
jgi:hypothetical protein